MSGPAVRSGRLLCSTHGVQEKLLPTARRVKKGLLHLKWTSITPSSPFLSMAQQSLVGQSLLITEASRSHSDTPHSVGLLWTSDQPDAKTYAWQHTTLITDRQPCPPVGFEPAIPASERSQTHALDCVATGIGNWPLAQSHYCRELFQIILVKYSWMVIF